MTKRGFLGVGVASTRLELHWTVPIGAFVFGGFDFAPFFWVAYVTIVLIHELGHAVVASAYGQTIEAIQITGFGGACRFSGDATEEQRGAIAWGGVSAQAVLLACTLLVLTITGRPEVAWAVELERAFIFFNAGLMLLNLLPIAPLDGKEAWGYVAGRYRAWRQRALRRKLSLQVAELGLATLPKTFPQGQRSARPRSAFRQDDGGSLRTGTAARPRPPEAPGSLGKGGRTGSASPGDQATPDSLITDDGFDRRAFADDATFVELLRQIAAQRPERAAARASAPSDPPAAD